MTEKNPTEPQALFKNPDNLVSDLKKCCAFDISEDMRRLAVARIAEVLTGKLVAVDQDGKPRPARIRETLQAIKTLANLEAVNLKKQAMFAEIMGLTANLKIEGRMALDLDALYRDAGIIDRDPIAERIEQERNSGGKGLTGGNGNGSE